MHIVHLINSSGWGGIEQYILDLSVSQQAHGHNVVVVGRDYPDIAARFAGEGIDFVTAPVKKMFDFTTARRIARLIPAVGHTVVNANNFRDAVHAIAAVRRSKNRDARVVVTRHMFKAGSRDLLARRVYRNADDIIFVSHIVRDIFLSTDPPVDRDKLHVVHSSSRYMPGDDFSASLNPSSTPVIAFCGRVVDEKGVDIMLKALSQLSAYQFKIKIIGHCSTDYQAELTDIARHGGISDRIEWVGYCTDIHPQLRGVDIAVLPTRCVEAFGLSMIECMAHGIAVVTTDNGAQPEYITHGITGLLVPPDDVDATTQAVKRLLDDPQLAHDIARAARRYYIDNLAYNRFYNKIMAIYERRQHHQ